jgi:hypothetical protein
MLCGLFITFYWLPRIEQGTDGAVKSLEEWEVGRDENGFSKTWLAKRVEPIYHWVAETCDKVYLWLDRISGGDEAERRAEAEQNGEEMGEIDRVQEEPSQIRC